MIILVTGAAGYLGSVLVPLLLDAGHYVTAVDTYPTGVPIFAMHCRHIGFNPIRADARDTGRIRSLIEAADVIIPLAGIVGAPACAANERDAVTTNTEAIR